MADFRAVRRDPSAAPVAAACPHRILLLRIEKLVVVCGRLQRCRGSTRISARQPHICASGSSSS